MAEEIFNRVEKKYLINEEKYNKLLKILNNHMKKDKYDKYTICNIYFDTKDNLLIRTSIEKPKYKEKLRLRSYGIPNKKDNVFMEIKKKYKKTVNKRRIILSYQDLLKYHEKGIIPKTNKQIFNEITYMINHYKLIPTLYLAYDREAYLEKNNNLRITFDKNIRFRCDNLTLKEDYGEKLLNDDEYIMEIKVLNAYPLWLAHALSDLEIYPISFSKYGKIYELLERRKKNV